MSFVLPRAGSCLPGDVGGGVGRGHIKRLVVVLKVPRQELTVPMVGLLVTSGEPIVPFTGVGLVIGEVDGPGAQFYGCSLCGCDGQGWPWTRLRVRLVEVALFVSVTAPPWLCPSCKGMAWVSVLVLPRLLAGARSAPRRAAATACDHRADRFGRRISAVPSRACPVRIVRVVGPAPPRPADALGSGSVLGLLPSVRLMQGIDRMR